MMELMDKVYWGNSVNEWLVAIAVLTGTLIVLEIVKKVLVRRVRAIARRTSTDIDDGIADLLKNTKFFFLLVLALKGAAAFLKLPDNVHSTLSALMTIGFILQAGIWGNTLIAFWFTRTMKEKMQDDVTGPTSLSIIKFIGRLVLWSVLTLVALDSLGVNVTAFITTMGIGGVAIALALQKILSDLFASLSIVLDKPFVVGDFIIVDDYMGSVEHIGMKTTRIKSLGGEQIIISNSELLASRIRNYKRMQERRILFKLGVTYQTPAQKLEKIPMIVRTIIEATPMTRFDRAHFMQYGDFSLNFEIVYFVLSADYLEYANTQQAINMAIYTRFEKEGIEFAYPTQTLFMNK
ncbi:MAG TPA: mechanosensitive ion channel family protein [Bacteroidota bacterium]|nr:mechanosensitive ion channel family protein [Bacteroidota bacterium]